MAGDSTIANNKRIAKNTLFLYGRMIVVTLVSLVTVKYTLKILGNSDFGVYSVVAGVVAFLQFVTVTISSATNRFLAYELGRRDSKAYNNTFNMLLVVFLLVAVVLLVLFEAIAHPVIYDWLQLPDGRRGAAAIVYQMSALSFLVTVLAIPFMASILANERMEVYAYIAIGDTFAKLLLLAVLLLSPFDKLLSYAVGTLFVTLGVNLIYVFYNQRYVADTRIYFFWDKILFRRLTAYTGWSFFGSVSSVLCNQGLSIVMNLFFGVGVNAAKAVADRIRGIIQSFMTNFYLAVSPQITKTYAMGDTDYMLRLVYSSTRLGFYLMMIVSVPAIILMERLLHLWLTDTCTDDIVTFTRLSLVFTLVTVFEAPITYMMRATGDIRRYQISVGVFTLLILPIVYVLFLMGCPAYVAFWCEIAVYAVVQFVRVKVAKSHFPVTIRGYMRDVLAMPMLISAVVTVSSLALAFAGTPPFANAFCVSAGMAAMIWVLGLHDGEKRMIQEFVRSKGGALLRKHKKQA